VEGYLIVINLFLELSDLKEAVKVVPFAVEDQLADEEDLLAVFKELCVCFLLKREEGLAQVLFLEVVLQGKQKGLPG
jgi:hypothetical protein